MFNKQKSGKRHLDKNKKQKKQNKQISCGKAEKGIMQSENNDKFR